MMLNKNGITSGLIAGIIVGTTVTMLSKKRRCDNLLKKNMGKTIKAVGSAIDNITNFMR